VCTTKGLAGNGGKGEQALRPSAPGEAKPPSMPSSPARPGQMLLLLTSGLLSFVWVLRRRTCSNELRELFLGTGRQSISSAKEQPGNLPLRMESAIEQVDFRLNW